MPRTLSLLFIESSEADFQKIERRLKEDGLNAHSRRVTSSAELADALSEGVWDAVLSDFKAPGFSFHQTYVYIRTHYPDLPVIVVSSVISVDTAVDLIKEGLWDAVPKDQLARLATAIKRAVKGAEELRIKRESEVNYRELFNNLDDAIFIEDRAGRFLDVNLGAEDMFGYPIESILGKTLADLGAPGRNNLDAIAAVISRAFTGEAQQFEFWGMRATGEVFPADLRITLTIYKGHSAVIAVARDISERKKAEQELSSQHTLLRTILESIPMRIFWKDRELRYLGANSAFAADAGLAGPEDLVGKDDHQLAWRDQAGHYQADDRDVMKSGQAKVNYEEPQTTPDGNQIWLRTSKVPLQGPLGEVIGVLGLYEDITASKESESKLRLQAAALEAAANAIIITDQTGVLQWANPAFSSLTGYPLDEIIGHTIGGLLKSGVHPPEFYENLWRTILGGQVWCGEIVNRRKNGSLYHEYMTITPVLDKDGSVRNFVTVKQDITERKQAEMQIRRLNRLYAMLGGINELIVRCHDAEQLYSEACRITVKEGGFRMAWLGLVDPASREVKPVAHAGDVDGYLDHLHIVIGETARGRGPTGQAVSKGKAVVCNDVANDERMEPWREDALRMGYRATAAFPLMVTGKLRGSLSLYADTVDFFDKEEIALLDRLSQNIGFALEVIEFDDYRRKADEALRHSEENLRLAQAVSQTGSWYFDIANDSLEWSDEAYRIFGLTHGPRLNLKAFLDCVHPEDRQEALTEWSAALQGGRPYDIEHRIVGEQVKWVRERAEIRFGAEGNPLAGVGTVQDITERKAAETLIQCDREQQATLRGLLETVLKGEQIEETLDYCLQQLLAVSWLAMLPKGGIFLAEGDGQTLRLAVSHDLSPQIMSLCERVPFGRCLCGSAAATRQLQYAHCVDERHEITYPGMVDHGHYSVPILSGDKLLGVMVLYLPPGFQREPLKEQFISSVSDILAGFISRKYAEQALMEHQGNLEALVSSRTAELDEARIEAERLARVKSEFLANMSHEIRTPLNAVLGFAQIGQRESKGRKSQNHFHRILNAGQLLLGVINDVLDFSKVEAGRLSLEERPFQLSPVIANAASFVAEAAKQKGLGYNVDAPPDLPEWVLGDSQRLQQILINFLTNAVKFTRQGEVRLRVAKEGDDIYFKVIDTGIGMSEEQLSRIFSPFEQADSSTTRKYGGTGLGLAISRSLAKLMGGEITVESALDAGSAFTLRLPLPAVAPPGIEAYPGKTAAAGPRLSNLRVLAAEDVEVNQLVLEDMLVHEGAQVVFADNGQQALEWLEEAGVTAFDVVLMDVQMPVMDGYEATRRIRKMAPELPVIGLTAHAMAEERQKCLAVGMVDCATKPIDMDTLIAIIRKHTFGQPGPAGESGRAGAAGIDPNDTI